MGDLTRNFSRHEFACHCGCGADAISLELVDLLQRLRDALGHGLSIESGVRCAAHNAKVGGKKTSAHLHGLAADIRCASSDLRYQLLRWLMHEGVPRIGIASTFIHIDLDATLPQAVTWLY